MLSLFPSSPRSAAEVSPQQALQLIERGCCIVDVREADEFAAGSLAQAQNLPLSRIQQHGIEALQNADLASSSTPLLLVCRSGARSGMACALLSKALGERAINLQGGVTAWARAGLPLFPRGLPHAP